MKVEEWCEKETASGRVAREGTSEEVIFELSPEWRGAGHEEAALQVEARTSEKLEERGAESKLWRWGWASEEESYLHGLIQEGEAEYTACSERTYCGNEWPNGTKLHVYL